LVVPDRNGPADIADQLRTALLAAAPDFDVAVRLAASIPTEANGKIRGVRLLRETADSCPRRSRSGSGDGIGEDLEPTLRVASLAGTVLLGVVDHAARVDDEGAAGGEAPRRVEHAVSGRDR